MFERLKGRLPKSKTKEEVEEYHRKIEEVGLEKGDIPAMVIAVILTIALPVMLILAVFYGLIYFVFLR